MSETQELTIEDYRAYLNKEVPVTLPEGVRCSVILVNKAGNNIPVSDIELDRPIQCKVKAISHRRVALEVIDLEVLNEIEAVRDAQKDIPPSNYKELVSASIYLSLEH